MTSFWWRCVKWVITMTRYQLSPRRFGFFRTTGPKVVTMSAGILLSFIEAVVLPGRTPAWTAVDIVGHSIGAIIARAARRTPGRTYCEVGLCRPAGKRIKKGIVRAGSSI